MACEECEIGIVLTDDREIKELNRKYRKINRPTDVLSFASRDGIKIETTADILGDVVISIQTAKKQAKEFRHSLKYEIFRLLVHGVLHLCGYEHEQVGAKVAQKMRRKEVRMFEMLVEKESISKSKLKIRDIRHGKKAY